MNMRITDEQLCAYLDDELDAPARIAMERALAEDARLKAKLARWNGQAAELRATLDAVLDEAVPESWLQLAGKPCPCLRRHPDNSRIKLIERLMQWLPSPRLATGLAFAIMAGVFVERDVIPRFDMDGQLVRLASVAHHVYGPDKRQPVEVKGGVSALIGWISKRLGAKVLAPDLAGVGYRFMGGRLLAGEEEPAAQFMYEEASGKRVTVFVRTEGATSRSTEPKCDAYRGVTVCYWYAGGIAYALAGEIEQVRLSSLAVSAAASTRHVRGHSREF